MIALSGPSKWLQSPATPSDPPAPFFFLPPPPPLPRPLPPAPPLIFPPLSVQFLLLLPLPIACSQAGDREAVAAARARWNRTKTQSRGKIVANFSIFRKGKEGKETAQILVILNATPRARKKIETAQKGQNAKLRRKEPLASLNSKSKGKKEWL